MKLKGKNILLISPESWGNNFVSKHHYAKELAKKRNTVYFLNRPSATFSVNTEENNLFVVDYKPKFKGLGKLPNMFSAYLINREIISLEKLLAVKFDVIWNFDSSRFFNLAYVKNKLRVCHIVDLSENFQRELLANTSDVCFCTSDFIADELKPYNNKVYKIHHGYESSTSGHHVNVLGLQLTDKLKVGYVGNLTIKYLDWELIYNLILENSSVEFYFIGNVGLSNLSSSIGSDVFRDKAKLLSNAFFLGQKSSLEIPFYLKQFDVNLLCYKASEYEGQLSSPHKFMEYFGSGNVIVSTYTDEYKDKRQLLEMVDQREEFINRFSQVVEDVCYHNSESKRMLRKEFAKQNTYSKQIGKIEEVLKTVLLDEGRK